jgi:hypothetical protein
MAGRYLRRMPLLSARNLDVLGDLLGDEEILISPSERHRLAESIDAAQRRLQVTDARRESLRKEINDYRVGGKPVPEDVALAMLSVMMHRYDKRRGQATMFAEDDPEPSRPVTANLSVYEAARLHLLHRFERPYFYGIDDLCDASSENAEQFLQLAAFLVETSATQVIRSKPALLSAETQHRLLRKRGEQIIVSWDFPQHALVRRLTAGMARRCVDVTNQPNGWLTPNAFGIPREEFEALPASHPGLAHVLQFGVAYNAVTLVPHHQTKGRKWCLLELGGMVILRHGLCLKRGGFIESSVKEIAELLQEAGP